MACARRALWRNATRCRLMALNVTCCDAMIPSLSGDKRTYRDRRQSVARDPTETLVAQRNDPFPRSIPAPSRVRVFPLHADWPNQVEIWFSLLQSQSLSGASFTAVKELQFRVLVHVGYQRPELMRDANSNHGRPVGGESCSESRLDFLCRVSGHSGTAKCLGGCDDIEFRADQARAHWGFFQVPQTL